MTAKTIIGRSKLRYPLNCFEVMLLFQTITYYGRVDRASATETVDSASIHGRVTTNTIKIDVHSFTARRLATEGTV